MKYLNFEGLQYFYSKLSSSLASQYVSQGNLKTINGQSLIGTGDITIEGGASGDYLPLSGGTLTGNVNMTGYNPIFKLTGENGYSITLQPEGENSDPSITIESPDGAPKVQVITSEGKSKLTGTELAFLDGLDNATSRFTDRYIQIGDRSEEFIHVSSSGIEKNGGSPTKVFATDGSVVDMNTYLPLSGGTMTGDIVRKDDQNRTIYNIGTVANGPWIQCFDRRNGRNITINGSEIKVFGGGGTATIPNNIRYAWDNIHFSLWPDNQTNRIYKFNLQKLIDDGYLIEE